MASNLRFESLEIREHGTGNQIGIQNNNYYNHSSTSDEAAIAEAVAELFSTNPVDDRSKQINKKGRRAEGTCSWVFDNNKLKRWMDTSNDDAGLLWISGPAGMGKAMLSIFLTQELERTLGQSPGTLVLYYFCDAQETKRNTPVNILRGLIFQLIQNDDSVAKLLLAEFKIQKAKLFEDNSLEALWRILRTMILQSKYSEIYGVLDGLDECSAQLLETFLKQVRFSFEDELEEGACTVPGTTENQCEDTAAKNWKPGRRLGDWQKFRLALVSREEPRCLLDELHVFPRVVLSKNEAGPTDLVNFTAAKVDHVVKTRGNMSGPEEVQAALQKRGDGTFLWVNMAMEMIMQKAPSESMVAAVESLGPTVEELYLQILSSLPEQSISLIITMLNWIVLVFRPLKLEELQMGLAFTLEQKIPLETITYAINMCRGVLVIQDNEVSIAHQSFQDFLMNSPLLRQRGPKLSQFCIDQAYSHSIIAKACVRYLEDALKPTTFLSRGQRTARVLRVKCSGETRLNQEEIQQMAAFPLLEYSVMHWVSHAKANVSDTSFFCTPFFENESKIRQMWLDIYWMSTHQLSQKFMTPTSFSLLHVAAYFGIMSLARHVQRCGLLQLQMAIRTSLLDRPLDLAIEQRQSVVAIFLLTTGALDIPQDNLDKLQYPLIHQCASSGDVESLSWFIQRGENVEYKTIPRSTGSDLKTIMSLALRSPRAVYYSLAEMTQPGELKMDDGSEKTPLHVAARNGRTAAVELLLKSGASVDPTTDKGWTPLHLASFFGHYSTVTLLLASSANYELVTTQRRFTPLHCAAYQNHFDCLRELVKVGAGIEHQCSKGRTPLHVAAKQGHNEILRLLLDNGANVDVLSPGNVSPLIEAAFWGKKDTVTLLLEWNANVWVRNQAGAKASDLAANKGYSAIVKLLLDREARITEITPENLAKVESAKDAARNKEINESWRSEIGPSNVNHVDKLGRGSLPTTSPFAKKEMLPQTKRNSLPTRPPQGSALEFQMPIASNSPPIPPSYNRNFVDKSSNAPRQLKEPLTLNHAVLTESSYAAAIPHSNSSTGSQHPQRTSITQSFASHNTDKISTYGHESQQISDVISQSPPSTILQPVAVSPRHSPSGVSNRFMPQNTQSTPQLPQPQPIRHSAQSYPPPPTITQSPPPMSYDQLASTSDEYPAQHGMHISAYDPSAYNPSIYGLMPTTSPPASYIPVPRPHSSLGHASNEMSFAPGLPTQNYNQGLGVYSHGTPPPLPPRPPQYISGQNNLGVKQVRKSRSLIDVNSAGIFNVLGVKLI